MIDLGAIEKRANAATEGDAYPDSNRWTVRDVMTTSGVVFKVHAHDDVVATFGRRAYAEFACHARTDIPALVAEVKKLRAALNAIKTVSAEGLK